MTYFVCMKTRETAQRPSDHRRTVRLLASGGDVLRFLPSPAVLWSSAVADLGCIPHPPCRSVTGHLGTPMIITSPRRCSHLDAGPIRRACADANNYGPPSPPSYSIHKCEMKMRRYGTVLSRQAPSFVRLDGIPPRRRRQRCGVGRRCDETVCASVSAVSFAV